MSKIPQEAIEAAELAAFYEWANDQWQNSRPPDNAWLGWKARADAARAHGAEAEPVAIYKGDGLIDCGESGHHNIELLKLIPSNTLLYTAPPAPQPTDREKVMEEALKGLLEACEADCGVPTKHDEDCEAVGAGQNGDGSIKPMALTFGHLRRARAALAGGEA